MTKLSRTRWDLPAAEQQALAAAMLERGLRDDIRCMIVTVCDLVDRLRLEERGDSCKPLLDAIMTYLHRSDVTIENVATKPTWVQRMWRTAQGFRTTATEGDPFTIT